MFSGNLQILQNRVTVVVGGMSAALWRCLSTRAIEVSDKVKEKRRRIDQAVNAI